MNSNNSFTLNNFYGNSIPNIYFSPRNNQLIQNNINVPIHSSFNNYSSFNNNQPMMNMLNQYNNLFNSPNKNNNPQNLKINFMPIINMNNNINLIQYMSYLSNYGFNQPYTFENTKKDVKKNLPIKNNYQKQKYNTFNDDTQTHEYYTPKIKIIKKDLTPMEKVEVNKWIEARKKMYPTKKNIENKKQLGELKVEKGLLSNLEIKLRKKVNILNKINGRERKKNKSTENKNRINKVIKKPDEFEEGEIKEVNVEKEDNYIIKEKDTNIIKEEENNIIKEEKNDDKKEKYNKFLCKKRNKKFDKKNNKTKNEKNISKKNNEKNNSDYKVGFKYKQNRLYDELIKKEKIQEQNIILQAIRYLLNSVNKENSE